MKPAGIGFAMPLARRAGEQAACCCAAVSVRSPLPAHATGHFSSLARCCPTGI